MKNFEENLNSNAYRDNLADALKSTRKVDKEKAEELLASEQNKDVYKEAENFQNIKRSAIQEEYKNKKDDSNKFEDDFDKKYGDMEKILNNIEVLDEKEVLEYLREKTERYNKETREKNSGDTYSKDPYINKDEKVCFVPDTDNKIAYLEYKNEYRSFDADIKGYKEQLSYNQELENRLASEENRSARKVHPGIIIGNGRWEPHPVEWEQKSANLLVKRDSKIEELQGVGSNNSNLPYDYPAEKISLNDDIITVSFDRPNKEILKPEESDLVFNIKQLLHRKEMGK